MSHHHHHHHGGHPPGGHHHGAAPHPHDVRAEGFPSLLRLSVLERAAIVGGLIAVLWGAIFWAVA